MKIIPNSFIRGGKEIPQNEFAVTGTRENIVVADTIVEFMFGLK